MNGETHTTAMYYSAGGAQRVIVRHDYGDTAQIEYRDGTVGMVESAYLTDFRIQPGDGS